MARLVIRFNDEIIDEIPFPEDSVTIGREKDNTVAIDHLAVSRHHARIDRKGADFVITDLQSTNGILVNEEQVVVRKLNHGDRIDVGKHQILFLREDWTDETRDEPEALNLGETLMLDTEYRRESLPRFKPPSKTPEPPEQKASIGFIDGSTYGEIELIQRRTRMGRADTSDIKLSGFLLGATAAIINRVDDGYTITFGGGMRKLRINGEVVKNTLPLKDLDVITIGPHKFQFYMEPGRG